MQKTIATALLCLLAACSLFAEEKTQTLFIDQLDLSITECGWNKTRSKKSVDGNPITINGRKFDRGVGHHAPGTIILSVPPVPLTFSSWVGIDDEVGDNGHAEFLVHADGKLVWRSGFMTGKDDAKLCEIPLENVKRLVLTVDTGPEGFAHDHTDWADAKIELNGQREVLTQGVKTVAKTAGEVLDDAGNIINRADENACEFLALSRELKKGLDPKKAAQALRPEATFLPTDRDPVDIVLRRTRALCENLPHLAGTPRLETETQKLDALDKKNKETPVENADARKSLFAEATALRKEIALKNPLLNFRDVIFIKRHFNPEPETQGNHMCDQFFGFHGRPGGGFFSLENAFSGKPTLRNILENSVIENGRLKGTKLDSTWAFLAPELSFDAHKILFAAADTKSPRHNYQWTEDNCYHLFVVNVDGSGLRQLTDGPYNEIDPCWLPNGRIMFISERRGGYGRCHGRPVPSYTLHSMNADGSDITMLSPHETNEWKPAVDNNGMIVYTRWDYVDRGHSQAHHPWITTPDGRDSRSIHGNFSPDMKSRPHFEATIRPIPNSQKLVAIATGHHAQYFGSIVLVDPNVFDDDAMSPVKRVTPEQLFPEVENAAHRDPANYGQPFPLSEDYYLCVYDPFSGQGNGTANNYGIYLLDSFGNKVLLYRDTEISSQCPIPLCARKTPPALPHQTLIGVPLQAGQEFKPVEKNSLPKTGIVGLTSVYSSRHPFPEGTKIKELRIVQLLPKTTPFAHNPAIGYGDQKGARQILGTVPVESDGSAYFNLPVDIPVYLQAIGEDGLVVQSMRSATYIKPGEELFCVGCHDQRYNTPKPTSVPTAFRRDPSDIKRDVEGTHPISYPLLVQPVLDKHCADCHEKEAVAKKTFRLGRGKPNDHFYESYKNLRPYAFFYDNATFTEAKTFPGKFGARASKLWPLLEKGHYDVSLSPEEKHRLAVWLDNNSDFYGSYENLERQRAGEVVPPTLE